MKLRNNIFKIFIIAIPLLFVGYQIKIKKSNVQSEAETEEVAEFNLYANVYDDGQKINTVEIKMPYQVKQEDLSLNTFSVKTKNELDKESSGLVMVGNGERKIKDIFLKGHQNEGDTIILKLDTGFGVPYADTLTWDDVNFTNRPLDIQYEITQTEKINNKKISKFNQKNVIDNEVDLFTAGESEDGIKYRDFKPKNIKKKHPLVIWFHGAGEGGDNNITHITADKGGVAFVTEEAQMILDEPYVLAPQSPDYWMENFDTGKRTLEGKDRTSELLSLIKTYIKNHEIDEERIYVGGASMGGYQTWEVIAKEPDLFAAAFPIATADEVPKDNLDQLKKLPIWMTHAKKDNTAPYTNSSDAYKYLKEINDQVHLSLYQDVKIGNEEFDPHASWIYTLNNEPAIEELKFLEWLSQQKNN